MALRIDVEFGPITTGDLDHVNASAAGGVTWYSAVMASRVGLQFLEAHHAEGIGEQSRGADRVTGAIASLVGSAAGGVVWATACVAQDVRLEQNAELTISPFGVVTPTEIRPQKASVLAA